MDRQIWFVKVWGRYYPCHWMGWLVEIGGITLILTGTFVGQAVLNNLGYEKYHWIPFPLFFIIGFVPMMIIARRHS